MPPREHRLTWRHSEAAQRGMELTRRAPDVRGGCGHVMQLPTGLASLQAGPGPAPGPLPPAAARRSGREAGCRLALPVRWHRDPAVMTEELAETVPGWVVSRGGRWQLLGVRKEGNRGKEGAEREGSK